MRFLKFLTQSVLTFLKLVFPIVKIKKRLELRRKYVSGGCVPGTVH